MIKNKVNGKVYIGKSEVSIENRWRCHASNAKSDNKYIYKAIRKYGIDNFEFKVLEECDSEECNEKEMQYIKEYNSYVGFENSNGYNLTLGGDGGIGMVLSEESKRKISLANKGRKHTDEAKRKISEAQIGEKHHYSKRVVCDNIEFQSITECAKYYGVSDKNMRKWISSQNKMPNKFFNLGLRLLDDTSTKYEVQTDKCGKRNPKSKTIICEGMIIGYCAREAVATIYSMYNESVVSGTLTQWLNGRNKMPDIWAKRGLMYEE